MLDDLLKDGRIELVSHVLSVAFGQDEIGVAQDPEMAGDRGPGGWESVGDLARGAWSGAEELEDLASGGIGEGAEDGVQGVVGASIR